MSDAMKNREVIFEVAPMGNAMRVSAFDVKTLTEVVIQVPLGASERMVQANALKRLEYVLRKKGLIA